MKNEKKFDRINSTTWKNEFWSHEIQPPDPLIQKCILRFNHVYHLRGGQNVKFHYYDRQIFSLHQKSLFSWSLLRHHYIENGFLVDHYYDKNKTFDVLILPMASKKITTSKIKISTTYGILPMVTKSCGALGG